MTTYHSCFSPNRRRPARWLVAAAVTLLTAAPAVSGHAQMIDGQGRLLVPERRTAQWAIAGGNRELIESTYARIRRLDGDEPGSWSHEWMQLASQFERRAQDAARRGDRDGARQAYLKASLYYAIGYFPENERPEQQASHRKHVETYVAASQFFDHAMEVVRIPLDGADIVVHLHLPRGVEAPPLVVWNGGTDWWKAGYHGLISILVQRGVAVAAFDLPGTGDSTAWVLGTDGGRLHRRVLDFLEQRGGFDFNRVGIIGVSFGGNYAVRVAASEPRVKAAVNFCGPIQRAFHIPPEVRARVAASPEGGTLRAVARASGLGLQDAALFQERFDLVKLGIVGDGRVIAVPILSVNGTRDPLVPVADLEVVHRSAPRGELWLLGMGSHCAVEYTQIVWPQVFDWLEERLRAATPRGRLEQAR
jgi:pimeloyl-ACP methyl ester carboxylesterase